MKSKNVVFFSCCLFILLLIIFTYFFYASHNFEKIPDYLQQSLNAKIININEISDKNSFSLLLFTDLHTSSLNEKVYESTANCVSYLSRRINLDAVVNMGDNISVDLGRVQHKSNDDIITLIKEIHSHFAKNIKSIYLPINGNHDGIGADFFNQSLWEKTIDYNWNNNQKGVISRNINEPYYFVDYPKYRIRIIFMSIPYESDLSQEHPTPLWKAGDDQLKWLANEALNTEDYYSVILITHVPTWSDYGRPDGKYTYTVWDGEKERTANYYALCGWVEDKTTIEGIFTAYHSHTSFSDEKISCDYSKYKNTQVIVEISGHEHNDIIIDANTGKNGMPCPVVTIASAGQGRITNIGTSEEVCFDIVTINQKQRIIDFTRIGFGDDRKVFY